ncbi:hypothetical protein ABZY09_48730 [Streptomyces sp. NPDC002928]|uniref:hypothetical protein n=1 Tax=Streptomyces sp. NPDC002928 TaxID=3154440 RepID=UPI0033A9C5A2
MGTGNRVRRSRQVGRALQVVTGSATVQLALALVPVVLAVLMRYQAADIHALVTNEVAILALVVKNERQGREEAMPPVRG